MEGNVLEMLVSEVAVESIGLVGKFCNEHREAAGVVVVAPSYAHRSEGLTFAVHGDSADHGDSSVNVPS